MKPLVAVTGASSGIGEAIARRFSEAGHPLLLMARRLERMQALGLPEAMCERVDLTDTAAEAVPGGSRRHRLSQADRGTLLGHPVRAHRWRLRRHRG